VARFDCLSCGESALEPVAGFSALPRITSDCRAFPAGGELAVCGRCATVQKLPGERWLDEIATIYRDYAAYELAGGEEQLVLDPESGIPRKRSEVLLNALRRVGGLPEEARALDVGCGHGVTLAAMAREFPGWQLFGYEIDDSKARVLAGIPNFRRLYTGEMSRIDGTFELVSMIHSLEHFVDPLGTLRSLGPLLAADGRLFVEVCNVDENPFDLLVADHLTHFSPGTLASAVRRAGLEVSCVATDWVRKELSLLASKPGGKGGRAAVAVPDGRATHARVAASVAWLGELAASATAAASRSPSFGVFGTAIAGTWLASSLGDRVKFFVDEDPHRIGREYLGKPVIAPAAVPAGSTVFLALAPTLARAIKDRLSGLPVELVAMPGPA
jgi:SAM-dependent methyltransferase